MRHIGRILWFSAARGYGFLACSQASDVFFELSSETREAAELLNPGDQVKFSMKASETGPVASAVRIVARPKRSKKRPANR